MVQAVVAKLLRGHPLPQADRDLLHAVVGAGRSLPPGAEIVNQGDAAQFVHLVLEGLAYRYKLLSNGKRQIIGYLVPGDFCDLYTFVLERMDHSIAARSECVVVRLKEADIAMLMGRPALTRALWWSSLVDEAILREWLLNVGRREPERRVAHIICELFVRLQAVGHASGNSFRLPVTQAELADTVGLTTVSVNRALQMMRRAKLISQVGRVITIPDIPALTAFADFNPAYLHFRTDGESEETVAYRQSLSTQTR
ncbi:Crp/Fnr family transcriptional regulator [Aureimonas mangrovi]|uniref:Crp/Fnr family transcriptional regulator n=1 Tax=Aureimonas mangrovi TaxID=2758041 RepID=UPI00163D8ACB|nr:Crp/Fnr family transcriptional regulator [Aureimonas mangrovi]